MKNFIFGKNKDSQITRLLFFVPILFIVLAFVYENDVNVLFSNLLLIFSTPDRLFTDYFALAGVGAAYLNAGLVTLIYAIIIKIVKPNLNGMALAAQYMTAGFAFIGMDLTNVFPIYLGVFLYAKFRKEEFKNYVYLAMLLADLSPFVSEVYFIENLQLYYSIPLGILLGVVLGFVINPIAQFTNVVNKGYNLYNVGFATGLLGIFVASMFKVLGYDLNKQPFIYEGSNTHQLIILAIISVVFVIWSFVINKNPFKDFIKIIKDSGRAPSDFMIKYGVSPTLLNMGLVGLLTIAFLLITKSQVSGGLLYAGFLSVLGFAAFGKHLRSVTYIYVGALVCSLVGLFDISSATVAMCILLGTAIAPIGGHYGMVFGMVAILIHLTIVNYLGQLHGFAVLYNNGFAAGFVAMILVPIIDGIRGGFNRD